MSGWSIDGCGGMRGRLMGWRECVRKRWRSGIELIGSYRKGKEVEEDGGDSGEGVGRMGV